MNAITDESLMLDIDIIEKEFDEKLAEYDAILDKLNKDIAIKQKLIDDNIIKFFNHKTVEIVTHINYNLHCFN